MQAHMHTYWHTNKLTHTHSNIHKHTYTHTYKFVTSIRKTQSCSTHKKSCRRNNEPERLGLCIRHESTIPSWSPAKLTLWLPWRRGQCVNFRRFLHQFCSCASVKLQNKPQLHISNWLAIFLWQMAAAILFMFILLGARQFLLSLQVQEGTKTNALLLKKEVHNRMSYQSLL